MEQDEFTLQPVGSKKLTAGMQLQQVTKSSRAETKHEKHQLLTV